MAKPLIFISHSAKEDPEAKVYLDALEKGLVDMVDPMVDRTVLQAGDEWRRELDVYLGLCAGGILLLSEKAVCGIPPKDASDKGKPPSAWVLKESTILAWRRALDETFPVIPVLIPPLNRAKLDAWPYSALKLNEIQLAKGDTPDQVVQKVRAGLQKYVDTLNNEKPPIAALERRLSSILDKVGPSVLEALVADLGLILDLGIPDGKLARKAARRLLKEGHAALHRSSVEELIVELKAQGTAEALIEILAHFWCNMDAVCRIPGIARQPDPRWFAIDTEEQDTGKRYIARAGMKFPFWDAIPITDAGTSSAHLDHLQGQIRDEVQKRYHAGKQITVDKAAQTLKELDREEPRFVVIAIQDPDHPPDSADLAALRKQFPTVTFCVLAGNGIPEDYLQRMGSPTLLLPKVDRLQEDGVRVRIMHLRGKLNP